MSVCVCVCVCMRVLCIRPFHSLTHDSGHFRHISNTSSISCVYQDLSLPSLAVLDHFLTVPKLGILNQPAYDLVNRLPVTSK